MAIETRSDFEEFYSRLTAELDAWAGGGPGRSLDDILTDGYTVILSLEGERLRTQARVEHLAVRESLDVAQAQELSRLVRHELQVAQRETDLRELLSRARAQRRRHAAA